MMDVTPYQLRRTMAIAMARQHYGLGRPPGPVHGEVIGRIFMRPVVMHLPGWTKQLCLFGLVPRSIGGISGKIPSWDSLDAHFQRRERKQNREKFQ